MAQGITLSLSEEDSALLQQFKGRTGVDPTTLGQLALRAIVTHLRSNQCLTLPLGIEAPEDCADCSYAKHLGGKPPKKPNNIVQGPWKPE